MKQKTILLMQLGLFRQILLQLSVLFGVLEYEIFTNLPVPGRVPALEVNQVLNHLFPALILTFRHFQNLFHPKVNPKLND